MTWRRALRKHNTLPLDSIEILPSNQEAADWYYHSDYTELSLTQPHYLPTVTDSDTSKEILRVGHFDQELSSGIC